jgi:hypothetical protein
VKDFSASAAFSEDRRFRTNADVPAVATKALHPSAGSAKNPFTGKVLRELAKGETVRVVDEPIYDPSTQNRNTMKFGETDILEVHDDLFVASNWSGRK